jgi:hypothetical protein
VKEQLKKCREFFTNFHSDDKSGVVGSGQGGPGRGSTINGHTPDSEDEDDKGA